MKNKHSWNGNKEITSDPSSTNYAKEVKNKANKNTPSEEDEPSTRTDYK